MIKRIGNKFYMSGFNHHIAVVEYTVSMDSFRVHEFIVRINNSRVNADVFPEYINGLQQAMNYAEELKRTYGGQKQSLFFEDLWEKETSTMENLKWKQEHVWGVKK